jgi:hypothetical protein
MTSILSQPTLVARGALVARLRQAAQHLETQRAAYQEAVEAYNAVLREVEAFRDSIIAALQEEIDRHPEAWLESRRGRRGWRCRRPGRNWTPRRSNRLTSRRRAMPTSWPGRRRSYNTGSPKF